MTDLWLIGIGTGNPDHLTLEGRKALRDAALILVPHKGEEKADLAALRHRILRDCEATARIVEFDMPIRDPDLPYLERVERWHDDIAQIWQQAIITAKTDGPVALLVWGDPGLYDSTLRIAARLTPRPALRVIPGITALQALTAAHRIPFNTVNGPVTITTGRKLRDFGWPQGAETVIVMLDSECIFQSLPLMNLHIWWGAYLGMSEQVLLSGPVSEISDQIIATRARERARHGWIMDTYLLRAGPGSDGI